MRGFCALAFVHFAVWTPPLPGSECEIIVTDLAETAAAAGVPIGIPVDLDQLPDTQPWAEGFCLLEMTNGDNPAVIAVAINRPSAMNSIGISFN